MKTRPALILCLWLSTVVGGTAVAAEPPTLTLEEAQDTARRNHPKISIAQLRSLASKQVVLQTRSAFLPQLSADISAVGGDDEVNTRIGAGSLGAAHVFDRAAGGFTLTQLITDFGRTANLTASSRLRSRAESENALATDDQIMLQVDVAYFAALAAQSVLTVSEQTLATRKLIYDRVKALAQNKLKSDLDLSFARVSVEEAKLLQAKAVNDLKSAEATLSTILGYRDQQNFHLVEPPAPPALPADVAPLLSEAFANRHELSQLRFEHDAALKFARAERALDYPTLKMGGSAGLIPERDHTQLNDHYAAAGLFLSVPLYEGGLYAARQSEATLRARAAGETLRDMENNIAHDVRIAWLNAGYAGERVALTTKMLKHASIAFDLAEARYRVGTSSIVELSQAQLSKTMAEIDRANAQYQYLIQHAVLNYQTGKTP